MNAEPGATPGGLARSGTSLAPSPLSTTVMKPSAPGIVTPP
jgi:hypothetical protein